MNEKEPRFGYFPKPCKTVSVVKKPDDPQLAYDIFDGTQIKITLTGERHLGALIDGQEYIDEYANNKVQKWVKDVEELATITEDEPRIGHSACTKALCMRLCFLQRAIPNTGKYFVPHEDAIRKKLIPAIIGKEIHCQ